MCVPVSALQTGGGVVGGGGVNWGGAVLGWECNWGGGGRGDIVVGV